MATLYDVIGSGNLRTEFLLDEKRRISSVLYINVCVFMYQEGPQRIPFPLEQEMTDDIVMKSILRASMIAGLY